MYFVDIPTTCHEARNRYPSGPVLIDLDGPPSADETSHSNLDPFLVYCDMTTYPHVAVTQIPHNRWGSSSGMSTVRSLREFDYQAYYSLKFAI
jgi:hypothetical protein